jgi:UDPglucose--hexose-1-phosphate uridylyltransferase
MISVSSHLRWNPLRREWVLVSPQRTARPWRGEVEPPAAGAAIPAHDPSCYLCPGAVRAGGIVNPQYASTFVFDNDFPALAPYAPHDRTDADGLLVARSEPGVCRVVCFSPRHDLALARLGVESLRQVVDVWTEEYRALGARPDITYVLIFENRGAAMGASNPHPHGQIWATATIPNEPAREHEALAAYRREKRACLLCDYAVLETGRAERVVCGNDTFVALVPYWAVWPFETMIVARRHVGGMDEMSSAERGGLAEILKRLTTRCDNLFQTPFPYSLGFHQRPTDGQPHEEAHFHAHCYPPLLRSATIRKFMVGFELLGTPQRDLTPEEAAARLRAAGEA